MKAFRYCASCSRIYLFGALAACLLMAGGCSQLRMLGSIVNAEISQVPARERAVAGMEKVQIPGPQTPIPARVYSPRGTGPFPVLMYFHGGGWTSGSPATHDGICRFLCSRAACVVVSVAYRLAPEHKFPAAFDDALAATLWAWKNSARLNADSGRLAVAGDSAGGNLAAAVALASRNRGAPPIAVQVLAFAATDMTSLDKSSYLQNDTGEGLTRKKVRFYRDQYLRDPADRINPFVSPLLAADHSGLPPALIIVGELDVARDDGLEYAEKLQASGVSVKVVRLSGKGHAVVAWALASSNVRQALEAAVQALQASFYDSP